MVYMCFVCSPTVYPGGSMSVLCCCIGSYFKVHFWKFGILGVAFAVRR